MTIGDDFVVDDEKSVTEKRPLIRLDNKVIDKNEFLNKQLAFCLDRFCSKVVPKYIKFDFEKTMRISKRSHCNCQPQ